MFSFWVVFCFQLLTIKLVVDVQVNAQVDADGFRPPIPSYYVDDTILQLSTRRLRACQLPYVDANRTIFALEELAYLSTISASDYSRGHELLAYHFFIENKDYNPHYRQYINEAETEYIPIMPLSWRSDQPGCSFSVFISFLLKTHQYLKMRDEHLMKADPMLTLPRRFFVASTFNMRTQWGTGMPTPYRRGPAWESISSLIQSLTVAHYERWPECPDLLRKWWKYAVEIPFLSIPTVSRLESLNVLPEDLHRTLNYTYLPLVSKKQSAELRRLQTLKNLPIPGMNVDEEKLLAPLGGASKTTSSAFVVANEEENGSEMEKGRVVSDKQYTFLFAGHFELPGPDRVCSTRNNILNIQFERNDILVLNITRHVAHQQGVMMTTTEYMRRSVFCLITSGDSYSTSFFYDAIMMGCLPIVIDDWFVFAFPWIVHYETFTLRLSENDFNTNPHYVLDTLKSYYLEHQPVLLRQMQGMMKYLSQYLSFTRHEYMSPDYYDLLSADIHYFSRNLNSGLLDTLDNVLEPNDPKAAAKRSNHLRQTLLPLELMLLEMRYEGMHHTYYMNVPCLRPLWCTHFPLNSYATLSINDTDTVNSLNPNNVAETIALGAMKGMVGIAKDVEPLKGQAGSKVPNLWKETTSVWGQQSALSFPSMKKKAGHTPNTNNEMFRLHSGTLRHVFERYRGMSWAILDAPLDFAKSGGSTSSLSSSAGFVRGIYLQRDDFQVHAVFIPPPVVRYYNASQHVLDTLPRSYFAAPSTARGKNNRDTSNNDGTSALSSVVPDSRPHICQHRARLVGTYKIVYFMQCVRVLWPLAPGKFKARDNVGKFNAPSLPATDPTSGTSVMGTIDEGEGLTREEYDFILALHNLSRPAHWEPINFPLASSHYSYYARSNRTHGIAVRNKRLQERQVTEVDQKPCCRRAYQWHEI